MYIKRFFAAGYMISNIDIIELSYTNDLKTYLFDPSMEIYLAFCLDVAQGPMKGAPNETRTHSCRVASRAC